MYSNHTSPPHANAIRCESKRISSTEIKAIDRPFLSPVYVLFLFCCIAIGITCNVLGAQHALPTGKHAEGFMYDAESDLGDQHIFEIAGPGFVRAEVKAEGFSPGAVILAFTDEEHTEYETMAVSLAKDPTESRIEICATLEEAGHYAVAIIGSPVWSPTPRYRLVTGLFDADVIGTRLLDESTKLNSSTSAKGLTVEAEFEGIELPPEFMQAGTVFVEAEGADVALAVADTDDRLSMTPDQRAPRLDSGLNSSGRLLLLGEFGPERVTVRGVHSVNWDQEDALYESDLGPNSRISRSKVGMGHVEELSHPEGQELKIEAYSGDVYLEMQVLDRFGNVLAEATESESGGKVTALIPAGGPRAATLVIHSIDDRPGYVTVIVDRSETARPEIRAVNGQGIGPHRRYEMTAPPGEILEVRAQSGHQILAEIDSRWIGLSGHASPEPWTMVQVASLELAAPSSVYSVDESRIDVGDFLMIEDRERPGRVTAADEYGNTWSVAVAGLNDLDGAPLGKANILELSVPEGQQITLYTNGGGDPDLRAISRSDLESSESEHELVEVRRSIWSNPSIRHERHTVEANAGEVIKAILEAPLPMHVRLAIKNPDDEVVALSEWSERPEVVFLAQINGPHTIEIRAREPEVPMSYSIAARQGIGTVTERRFDMLTAQPMRLRELSSDYVLRRTVTARPGTEVLARWNAGDCESLQLKALDPDGNTLGRSDNVFIETGRVELVATVGGSGSVELVASCSEPATDTTLSAFELRGATMADVASIDMPPHRPGFRRRSSSSLTPKVSTDCSRASKARSSCSISGHPGVGRVVPRCPRWRRSISDTEAKISWCSESTMRTRRPPRQHLPGLV